MPYGETEQVPIHHLVLDDDELELIHNLLSAGPRLGSGYYSDLAYELLEVVEELRGGELDYDLRLFDGPEGFEGFTWVRTEPLDKNN